MPTNEITLHNGAEVARIDKYDQAEMVKTLKETVCKGATDSQFRMFIEVCRSTGLNPFLREVWFVPSVGIMAGRDGYLRVANDHPQFDGMETRVTRDEKNVPIKAICTVWRKDRNHPITCEAYYSEYKKSGNVWSQYPSAMISKVSEVLALKRSFAINGVVTEEEIGTGEPAQQRGSKEAAAAVAQAKIAGTMPLRAPDPPSEPETPFDDMVPVLEESIRQADERNAEPAPIDCPTDKFQWFAAVEKIKNGFLDIGQETAYRDILKGFGGWKRSDIKASDRSVCYRRLQELLAVWRKHFAANQYPDLLTAKKKAQGDSPVWIDQVEHIFNDDTGQYEVKAG